jgi:hypothetical protein
MLKPSCVGRVRTNHGFVDGWLKRNQSALQRGAAKIKLLQAVSFCATSNIQRTAVTLLQRMRSLFVK